MIDLTPSKLERARAAREVATALSLYTSGKFRAPRLLMFGSVIRTALSRVDREDSENLPEVMADAVLFGQCVESRTLGMALPDPAKFPPGVQTTLARAIDNVERWTPIIKSLTALLLRDGRVTGSQMIDVAERGDNYGKSSGQRKRRHQH
jgi:hypothetical protein